jgi:hypothetical protein
LFMNIQPLDCGCKFKIFLGIAKPFYKNNGFYFRHVFSLPTCALFHLISSGLQQA